MLINSHQTQFVFSYHLLIARTVFPLYLCEFLILQVIRLELIRHCEMVGLEENFLSNILQSLLAID